MEGVTEPERDASDLAADTEGEKEVGVHAFGGRHFLSIRYRSQPGQGKQCLTRS